MCYCVKRESSTVEKQQWDQKGIGKKGRREGYERQQEWKEKRQAQTRKGPTLRIKQVRELVKVWRNGSFELHLNGRGCFGSSLFC